MVIMLESLSYRSVHHSQLPIQTTTTVTANILILARWVWFVVSESVLRHDCSDNVLHLGTLATERFE